VTCGTDPSLTLYDLAKGQPVTSYQLRSPADDMSVDFKEMRVCTGGALGLVEIYDLERGECTQTIDPEEDQITCLDVNWEEGLLVTCHWNAKVQLRQLSTGTLVKEFNKCRRVLTGCSIKS